eukprot:COSAG01_NODE_5861_length_3985_cov_4.335821_2_plen_525_part_00
MASGFSVAALLRLLCAASEPPSLLRMSLDPSAGGESDWAPVIGWRSGARATSSAAAVAQIGLSPDRLTHSVSAEAYATHPGMGGASFSFVTLRGLLPDTTYFYRVGNPPSQFTAVHNLTTPPRTGSKPTPPWSFLAYGDLGTAPSDHEGQLGQDMNCTTNTTVNADPPGCPDVTLRQLRRREWDGARPSLRHELVLHVGDIVYADYGCNLSTNVAWWDLFGQQTEFLAASRPYLICPGNHDLHGRSGPGAEPGASSDLESLRYNARYRMPPRRQRDSRARQVPIKVAGAPVGVAVPGPERYYYAYSHRNIRFVSISTEHDLSPGSEQYEWLETELAAADMPTARSKQPWLLLYGHKPPVCSHESVCGEAAVPLGLFSKYHVDLALWGHLHAFERTFPMVNKTIAVTGASYHNAHGTPHVMIGMAGDGFCCGGWTTEPPRWSAFREDSFGYARIWVESDTELRLEYVRNGDSGHGVRDNFTITKNLARASVVWHANTTLTHKQHRRLIAPRSHLGHRARLCPEIP